MSPFFWGGSAVFLALLARMRCLSPFLLSAVLGLLTGVLAVCLAPLFHLRFSLNLFTGTVCVLLGPAGAAGLLALSFLWEL